jgi:putative membrane protein
MSSEAMLTSYWHWNLTALVMAVIFIAFHFITNGFRLTRKSLPFFGGILLLFLATFSSLDYIGHHYLFSFHMIEHIILLLVIPPLLLIGTDKDYLEKLTQRPWFKAIGRFLFYPVVSWVLGIGAMWVWHIPVLFHTARHSPVLQIIHTVSLLLIGIIFIWPVYTPARFKKLQPLQSALYLFTACTGCTVLGIFITFAPAGLYTPYFAAQGSPVFNFIQTQWGITPGIDQQMGGLIMWVPACIIYLSNIMIIFARWYREPELEKTGEIAEN